MPGFACLVMPPPPSECLYHVCIFVAALQSTYPSPAYHASQNPRMILCHFPLGWTKGLPERRRAGATANKHAASSIYSLYVHPTQHDSSSLGLLLPTRLPRSRSNDRQAARLFGTPPPHVSSLRDLSTAAPSTKLHRRCTKCPLPFFHPRV